MLIHLFGSDQAPLDTLSSDVTSRSSCSIFVCICKASLSGLWPVAVPDRRSRGASTCKMSPPGANGSASSFSLMRMTALMREDPVLMAHDSGNIQLPWQ